MKTAICLAAPTVDEAMAREIREADVVIVADSGARLADLAGRVPDVAIGDFDSLSAGELSRLTENGVGVVRADAAKDQTDGELALAEALRRGSSEVVFVGGLGGRVDHALGNLGLLVAAAEAGVPARIVDGTAEVHYLRASGPVESIAFDGRKGWTVSIVPFGCEEATVSAEGFMWPLENETLSVSSTRGISNVVAAERAVVTLVREGAIVVAL